MFDYAREDLADAVTRATDGGVDVILDHRLDDYLQLDADVVGERARVVGIGENNPDPGFTNDGVARSKDVSYQFMSMFNTPDLRIQNGSIGSSRRLDSLFDRSRSSAAHPPTASASSIRAASCSTLVALKSFGDTSWLR